MSSYPSNNKICMVCGLKLDFLPWGASGNIPSYGICPCCGTEFGTYDREPQNLPHLRKLWLEAGATWFIPESQPDDWDLTVQLAQIPAEIHRLENLPLPPI